VKSVAEDLDGEMKRLRDLNHVSRVDKYEFISWTIGSIVVPELSIFPSSAYDTSLMFPGGAGILDI